MPFAKCAFSVGGLLINGARKGEKMTHLSKSLAVLMLWVSTPLWANAAPITAISGKDMRPYHGYVGLGAAEHHVRLKDTRSDYLPGLVVQVGNHFRPWLDLEFRAGTGLEESNVHSKALNSKVSFEEIYHVAGLLKFNWKPIRWFAAQAITGFQYRHMRVNQEDQYRSTGLAGLGATVFVHPKWAVNVEYLSDLDSVFSQDNKTYWNTLDATMQFHF